MRAQLLSPLPAHSEGCCRCALRGPPPPLLVHVLLLLLPLLTTSSVTSTPHTAATHTGTPAPPYHTTAAAAAAPHGDELTLALETVRRLGERLEAVEQRMESMERAAACGATGQFPTLAEGAEYAYEGCMRNVARKAANSTTMCQAGTIKIYDTQTTNTSGVRPHTELLLLLRACGALYMYR